MTERESFDSNIFWRDFVEASASLSKPIARKDAFAEPLSDSAEVFATLVAAADQVRAGKQVQLRLYAGDEKRVRRQMPDYWGESYGSLLPFSAEKTLAEYGVRLRTQHGFPLFGVMLNDAQTLSPALWVRVRGLLSGLFQQIEFPLGGADCNVFAGNYNHTPFGVHTDARNVFTWIVEGEKHFLTWPHEVIPETVSPHAYEPYRQQALPLTGTTGDLLFWPRSYWHVAESQQSSLVTTLSIGLDDHMPVGWVTNEINRLVGHQLRNAETSIKSLQGRGHADAPEMIEAALRICDAEDWKHELARELRLKWLCWTSGLGLRTPPPAHVTSTGTGRLYRTPYSRVAVLRWNDELLCGANGHGFRFAYSLENESLLNAISCSSAFTVPELIERHRLRVEASVAEQIVKLLQSLHVLMATPPSSGESLQASQ